MGSRVVITILHFTQFFALTYFLSAQTERFNHLGSFSYENFTVRLTTLE